MGGAHAAGKQADGTLSADTHSADTLATDAVFTVSAAPPPGFEDLSAVQTTEADLYYGGEYLASVFVEFDPYQVTITNPLAALQLIPNLKDPERIAQVLSGPLPTNAEHLCTTSRRAECGRLYPDQAAVIFDENRFRLHLFVNAAELLVHPLQVERYLPQPSSGTSALHNIRLSASGTGGERQYNLTSESFLAHNRSRLRSRYGLTDEGASLYELAWQRDGRDLEYEVGSFRTQSRNLSFASDVDVLGFRLATSTKTRTDLDHALGTPIYLFLQERSRVDVFRGNELLDSQFYAAGNQQLDTAALPDGAYDITIRTEGVSGASQTQTQFFVRSGQLPPLHEPQLYLEGGKLLNNLERGVPRSAPGTWLRGGVSHRVQQNLAWDNEALFANGQAAAQSGVFWLQPGWHLYGGAMLTSEHNFGLILRGGIQRQNLFANFDVRHVSGDSDGNQTDAGEYAITRGGYTQAFASVGFPLGDGRLFLRGRYNNRFGLQEKDFGFSYLGAVFKNRTRHTGMTADLQIDGGVGNEQNWIRIGINLRWQPGGGRSATLQPRLRYADGLDSGLTPELTGRWQRPQDVPLLGVVNQAVYAEHTGDRSAVGVRYTPQTNQQSDFEFGYQRNRSQSDLFYALNNRFSVVHAAGGTTFGDGGSNAGAVIVRVNGDFNGKFAVLVGNRVVGHTWSGQPNVISLRPYESYDVRIKPLGDGIIGYDEAPQTVTLYPGNVETVEFHASELMVLIGQALWADGTPVARARVVNVEGFGMTDERGWFQVEVSHDAPLVMRTRQGDTCIVQRPPQEPENGLVVYRELTCQPES
ncbi:MAG: TcfC E-set like domain-containing protein [Pseudomonadota bacterium]